MDTHLPEAPPTHLSQDTIDVSIAFIVLTTVALCLRFISRKLSHAPWAWPDIVMVLVWAINIGICAISIKLGDLGMGQHMTSVPMQDWPTIFKLAFYADPVLYACAVVLPKLVILDLYAKVFIDRTLRWIVYGTQFLLITFMVTSPAITLTLCQPMAYLWDKSIEGGWCKDFNSVFLAASYYNISTDIIVLLLPLPLIKNLQSSIQVKLGLLLTFACGSLGLVTSIIRLIVFANRLMDADPMYNGATLSIWTVVEAGVYFICACMITYRPLCRWISAGCPWVALARGLPYYLSTQQNSAVVDGDNSRMHRVHARELRHFDSLDDTLAGTESVSDTRRGDSADKSGTAEDVHQQINKAYDDKYGSTAV